MGLSRCRGTQARGLKTPLTIERRKAAEHAERRALFGVGPATIDVDQLLATLAVEEARIYDAAFDPDFGAFGVITLNRLAVVHERLISDHTS